MIIAIHQPNYAPWLGYFAKVARADTFVFLDDVQFSKNSYINRVQVDARGQAKWLTVPVKYNFGDPIFHVRAADDRWRESHLDMLRKYYGNGSVVDELWVFLKDLFAELPTDNIAVTNQRIIEVVAARLGLHSKFVRSSAFDLGDARGDDRLISIMRAFGPNVTYLSGKGGANYQDSTKFVAAGIDLTYSDFSQPTYDQGHGSFLPGLSILDALFRLGFDRTAALLMPAASSSR